MRRRGPRAGKRDANQTEIVGKLRQLGASVLDLSSVGLGCPDLCVGFRGHDFWIELKAPGGRLLPGQVQWAALWRGSKVHVVRSFDEALTALGVERTCFDPVADDVPTIWPKAK